MAPRNGSAGLLPGGANGRAWAGRSRAAPALARRTPGGEASLTIRTRILASFAADAS